MNLEAALPPSLESVAAIQSVEFGDSGGGRLECIFLGEVRLPSSRLHALMEQLKAR
jgi:hypothetical protein